MKDDKDIDLQATAKRETMEEIGLKNIEILAKGPFLPDKSKTIRITPFIAYIGVIHENELKTSDEVESILTIPIELLKKPETQIASLFRGQVPSTHWNIMIQRECHLIWGLTAFFLHHLIKCSP